jgi:hypothetical protein
MTKKGIRRTLAKARGKTDIAQNKMLKELAKDVSQLKASVEKKYSYISNEGIGIQSWDPTSSTSRSQNIFPIRIGSTQGLEDVNERVGDLVNLKSIDLRYTIQIANGAVVPANPINRVRAVLFWDTDPVSTNTTGSYFLDTPEWNLMFQTPTLLTAQGSQNALISGKDHDTGRRFQLLHDKTHTLCANLNGNLTTSSDPTVALGLGPRSATGIEYVNKSYKIGRKLRYKAGGTIPINRSLYVGFISDSVTGASVPIVNYTLKCLYEDA